MFPQEYRDIDKIYEQALLVSNYADNAIALAEKLEKAIDTVVPALSETIAANKKRWYAVKVLENDEKVMNHIVLDAQAKTTIDALRKDLETELDDDMESIVTDGRYTYIQKIISTTVEKPKEKLTISDKIEADDQW